MAYDPTLTYATNKNLFIYFQSLHTPSEKVKFKAFIESFSTDFSSNWNTTTVFGRMDPIHTFQNTQRVINLSWKTTSINVEEGIDNLKKVNLLTKMLYPTYEDPGASGTSPGVNPTPISTGLNTLTIARPPLMRVRFVNMINGSEGTGLIGAISGFSYTPDFGEEGVFDLFDNIVPKTISISCTINVLHEQDLGWSQDGRWLGSDKFAFGPNFAQNVPTTTSAPAASTEAPADTQPNAAKITGNPNVSNPENTEDN